MKHARFQFYAELNDFLSPGDRRTAIGHTYEGKPSVKHLIETLGVPHTEVNRILVNHNPVGFDYHVQDGDEIQVYPVPLKAGKLDRSPQGHLTREARFIIDNHLGKLAAYLRMLGFDSLYRNDYQDDELAEVSSQDGRILLTRDIRLLMRSIVIQGYWVRAKDPKKQIIEVAWRFGLLPTARPFRRCMRCNGILQPIRKEAIVHKLEPKTKNYFEDFRICPGCDQVYWKGSHYERMQRFLEQVLNL